MPRLKDKEMGELMASQEERDAVLDFLRQREDASVDEMVVELGFKDEDSVRSAIDDLRDGHLHVNIVNTDYRRFGLKSGKWRGRNAEGP